MCFSTYLIVIKCSVPPLFLQLKESHVAQLKAKYQCISSNYNIKWNCTRTYWKRVAADLVDAKLNTISSPIVFPRYLNRIMLWAQFNKTGFNW